MAIEISVVVPAYNRRDKLLKLLKALCHQNFPKEEFEVIVVDDGSTQNVWSVVNYFNDAVNLRYMRKPHSGPAAARNKGIKNARGEFICLIDDDCIPEKNWLKKFYTLFQDDSTQVAGGLTKVRDSNLKALLGQFMANGAIKAEWNGKKCVVFLPTSNVALRKEVFEKFSFNPWIPYPGGEDLEFFWKLFKAGYNLKYNPGIEVLHLRNESFKEFLLQPYIYGKGNYWVKRFSPDHPALQELKTPGKILYSLTQIPLYAFYIAFMISKLYNKKIWEFVLLYFYATVYRFVYFWGYLREGMKDSKRNRSK